MEDLTIEITQNCPLRCLHCSSRSSPERHKTIDLEKMEKQIKERSPVEEINISGGEPFNHERFFEAVKICKRYAENVNVYTCGVMEDGEIRPIPKQILDRCQREGVDSLVFSLHGKGKNFDEFTQTRGSRKCNSESMERAFGSVPQVEVHIVPNRYNIQNLEELVKYVLDREVDRISFLRLVKQGRAAKNPDLFDFDEKRLSEILWKFKQDNPNEIDIGTHFSSICASDRTCRAGEEKAVIDFNNEIYPCSSVSGATENEQDRKRFSRMKMKKSSDCPGQMLVDDTK